MGFSFILLKVFSECSQGPWSVDQEPYLWEVRKEGALWSCFSPGRENRLCLGSTWLALEGQAWWTTWGSLSECVEYSRWAVCCAASHSMFRAHSWNKQVTDGSRKREPLLSCLENGKCLHPYISALGDRAGGREGITPWKGPSCFMVSSGLTSLRNSPLALRSTRVLSFTYFFADQTWVSSPGQGWSLFSPWPGIFCCTDSLGLCLSSSCSPPTTSSSLVLWHLIFNAFHSLTLPGMSTWVNSEWVKEYILFLIRSASSFLFDPWLLISINSTSFPHDCGQLDWPVVWFPREDGHITATDTRN